MSSSRKKPTAQRKAGRTALRRPAARSRRKAPPPPPSPYAFLARRPMVLAGLAAGLLVAGMGIGYLLGEDAPPTPAASPASPQRTVSASSSAVGAEGARRAEAPPTASLAATVRAAQAAPDYQDDSVSPPGVALPGVRITDAPEAWGGTPPTAATTETQVAALPTPPPRAVAPETPAMEQPAWLRHAVPAPVAAAGRPMIAIVIDDMGIDQRRSARVMDLPGPVTTSFLTYAPDGPAQARKARAKGHEILIHIPMEPSSAAVDPGPGALRTGMSADAIRAALAAGLAPYDGYVGINNHMGSRFTADAKALAPVIEAVKGRGLLWLDSRTTADSAGMGLAKRMGVPFAERHVFLDHQNSLDGVLGQLAKLEAVARKYGHAVAIGHPKDHTIAALQRWLPTLEGKGLALVPLSAIVRARTAAAEAG